MNQEKLLINFAWPNGIYLNDLIEIQIPLLVENYFQFCENNWTSMTETINKKIWSLCGYLSCPLTKLVVCGELVMHS